MSDLKHKFFCLLPEMSESFLCSNFSGHRIPRLDCTTSIRKKNRIRPENPDDADRETVMSPDKIKILSSHTRTAIFISLPPKRLICVEV